MKTISIKGFAFTIVLLFLGVSILPNICGSYEITDDFDSKIVELMKKAHMPSLVACIIKDNVTAWSKGYGYSDYYNKKNTSEDIVYPVASLTKSVTATPIMQIVENDSYDVNLDDNVSKYLPFDLKNPKYPDVAITFRMLLAHQSSLGDTTLRFTLIFKILKIPYNLMTFEKYLSNPKVWKDYKPGEGVCYSTEGIDILGLLIQQVTNQSYSDYCQEHIFKPLKMYNTSFYFSDYNKEQLACLYSWIAGFYFKRPFTQTSYVAGMGLKTTLSDFSRFLIMHTSGGVYDGVRVLSKESVDEMHSVQYLG